MKKAWKVSDSLDLYHVNRWGHGYFGINEKGNVVITPEEANLAQGLDIYDLVDDLKARGLRTPILLRFTDIVNSRVKAISECFQNAITTYNYKGKYNGVYPIKVNQQRQLVEELVHFGRDTNLGLEAGSKPELLVAISVLNTPGALLICNGFKDIEYIETALLSQKLGRKTIVVIDRIDEIEIVIQAAKKLNIKPQIGFRAKLESRGAGKWAESSGVRSKFGLSPYEMIYGIELLRQHEMLDSLVLLHFHIGSQITNIRSFKESLQEASRIFIELHKMGAHLEYMDVGGGLGVDYDGSRTSWDNSMNYTVQEYANDIIYVMQSACDEHNIPHPHIVTESGRALVAYHSVLVFDVVGCNEIGNQEMPKLPENAHKSVHEMMSIYDSVSNKNYEESFHDALALKENVHNLFSLGYLSLKERADAEIIFWKCLRRVERIIEEEEHDTDANEAIEKMLSYTYYCNFSVFQSLPDNWAVKQLFPIMPIHRHTEEPVRKATLVDLTCDSDGKIDRFIGAKNVNQVVNLHPFKKGQPYYLGIFLVGAYQEILGDLHNLLGDTDAVHVSITPFGYEVLNVVEGDSVGEVLNYVQYDRAFLVNGVRLAIEESIRQKTITLEESRNLMRHYESGLSGYTYLEEE